MVLLAKAALTPAGKPVAAPIPVAPVVLCVMALKGVLIQSVGVEEAAPAVLLGLTVNVPLLVAVPLEVVTAIVPVVPLPTVAVICVAEFTVKELTAVPPIVTALAPVKFIPVIVTVLPAQPEEGVKEVIEGVTAQLTPVVTPPGAIQLETGPLNAKLNKAPLFPFPLASVKVVTPVFVEAAAP